MPQLCITYTNILVSKNTKNVRYPQREFSNLRHPTQNPTASQWYIGCVGFHTHNYCVGHVHFMLFVSVHLRLVANTNAVFSGIWA